MSTGSTGYTVLVVEDNPDHTDLIEIAFTGLAPNVSIAPVWSAEEAIEYLRGQGPDTAYGRARLPAVIVLDINMPGIGGLGFLQWYGRQDRDILTDVPISFAQAALGAELNVPTIDGPQTLAIPPGTQAGSRFRLKGFGVPDLDGRGRGDQHVFVQVRTPTKLSAGKRHLLEQLAELDGEEPDEPGLFDRVKNIFN